VDQEGLEHIENGAAEKGTKKIIKFVVFFLRFCYNVKVDV